MNGGYKWVSSLVGQKIKARGWQKLQKKFLSNVLHNAVGFFFSPEMYKGTRADNEIHKNLMNSDKCIVFTYMQEDDNEKN